MSPRSSAPRTLLGVVVAVLIVVAIGAVVAAVRAAAPSRTLQPILPAAPDPNDPLASTELVTCERTLPDAPKTQEQIEEVDPVGRISSSAVNECPDAFDGQVVLYVGEAIGDVLHRGGGAWVLVNDDAYALEVGPIAGHDEFRGGNSGLSVWLPDPLPDEISGVGGPHRRGDVLEIRGVIRRTDPADGGGLTLRALDAEVIVPSEEIDVPVNRLQVVVAAVFALAALALTLAERSVARRR